MSQRVYGYPSPLNNIDPVVNSDPLYNQSNKSTLNLPVGTLYIDKVSGFTSIVEELDGDALSGQTAFYRNINISAIIEDIDQQRKPNDFIKVERAGITGVNLPFVSVYSSLTKSWRGIPIITASAESFMIKEDTPALDLDNSVQNIVIDYGDPARATEGKELSIVSENGGGINKRYRFNTTLVPIP